MKQHKFTDKVGKFLDGKGFYIALALCLVVIGGSTYYLVGALRNLSPAAVSVEEVSGTAEIVQQPLVTTPVMAAEEEISVPEEEEAQEAQEAAALPDQEAETVMAEEVIAETEPQTLRVTTWPIQGSVVAAFSPDTLVANETMGDWRTHAGIDLAAAEGTNVQAVADGTVTAVDYDLILGQVVTVSHSDGLSSIYGNLGEELLVEVGDRVSAGCVLGQVGTTAAGETAMGDHLHFAMELDGDPVDPGEYLP
jgi:murein DD-endopeptidase MepM/ murein hydrolase activator NlpD